MNRLKQWLKNPKTKPILAVVVLIVTVIIFVRFFAQHPNYVNLLRHVKPSTVLAIMALNVGALISLVFVYTFTLDLCGHKIPIKEQALLTAYSSIANFFGPLQSGPGVRAVYLKAKHKVSMRDYAIATLFYYAIFALICALFLFGGSLPWQQAILVMIVVALVCFAVIKYFINRSAKKGERARLKFSTKTMVGLIIATFAQLCFITGYYFVELAAVKAHASLRQVIVYSGAANFAIFVSLTPDAIGFRESFLVLAKKLHGIGTAAILAANLIDRAVYALFLGILFIFVLIFHIQDRFKGQVKST